jgi:hypothetical protein
MKSPEAQGPWRWVSAPAGIAAGLAVVAVAALIVTPDDRSSIAQDTTQHAGTDWAQHECNLERLRQVLGPADWHLDYVIADDGQRHATTLLLDSHSAEAQGLSADNAVTATINVAPTTGSVDTCPLPVNPFQICEMRHHVRISRKLSSPGQPAPAAETRVEFALPNDRTVTAGMLALAFSAPTHEQAHTWAAGLDDKLIAAATDSRAELDSAPPPPPAPAPAKDVDYELFRRHLGAGWLVAYDNSGGIGARSISLDAHSMIAKALPKGWRGSASFAAGAAADPYAPATTVYPANEPCTERVLPDGRKVQIRRAHSTDSKSAYEGLRVAFTAPDGTRIVAEIGTADDASLSAAARKRARAWVDAFEGKLIATVTDQRIERIPDTAPGR